MDKKKYTIDAKNQRLGRVASRAAHILLGKDSTDFAKNIAASVHVTIENAASLDMTEKKRATKTYTRYSGHPGGLKTETLQNVLDTKGAKEALRRAIYNMLPKNRLRKERMKNVTIK